MVFEKIKKIIAGQLSIDEEEVKLSSTFTDDLGVDSLEIFEIVMSLEDEFGIEIPNEDIEDMKTVGDIVKYVESKTE
ncbi:acyl carrier protein [Haloimpatiens lingqiaonensis]|uniref:acyl carrier protein n=1 Tax=Haloimpatiens lingqiaonensis TaxID=1380675 RepID=UPI0010FDC25A|nr:acyl carrier protein [Haloimpatiens lingqiaonensis]